MHVTRAVDSLWHFLSITKMSTKVSLDLPLLTGPHGTEERSWQAVQEVVWHE